MKTKKGSAAKKNLNKSAFVRSLPATMPAKNVVEKAKAAGIEIKESYVYEIRSAGKRKAGRGAGRGRRGRPVTVAPVVASTNNGRGRAGRPAGRPAARPAARPAGRPVVSGGSIERALAQLVLDVGLKKAEDMLSSVAAKLRSVAG